MTRTPATTPTTLTEADAIALEHAVAAAMGWTTDGEFWFPPNSRISGYCSPPRFARDPAATWAALEWLVERNLAGPESRKYAGRFVGGGDGEPRVLFESWQGGDGGATLAEAVCRACVAAGGE